ncbi:MAG: glycosyltransferase family 4 protein [Planctomycetaceae bacterium]
MKIAIITAGGAGMFCGSCMQDNTLARTLRLAGEDAVLVPTYTPITVDEEDVSSDRVFLGGINVYLDSAVPGWRWLPGWMTHWLDRPAIIRTLAKFGSTDAARLGSLTLDMLKGNHGPQRREVEEFGEFLCGELQPDVIIFSNALLSGMLSELRPRFSGTILCLLQGDDVFLEALAPRWKQPVLQQLRQNCNAFDGFLTHSDFYRLFMAEYLQIAEHRFRRIPLTIDIADLHTEPTVADNRVRSDNDPFCIGYFARICPEKGVQNLLTAAAQALAKVPLASVNVAGYLAPQNRRWFERLLNQANEQLDGRVRWLGSPTSRAEKFSILRDFDVLCVPTDYREPKGLYVLEAGLAGVPSLLPRHGAFPELVEGLGHGRLYDPQHPTALAEAITVVCSDRTVDRHALPERVRSRHSMTSTGTPLVEAIRSFQALSS